MTGLVIKVFPSTLTYIRKSSIKVLRTRGIGVPEVLEDWDPEADNALLDGIAAEIQQNIPLGHQTRAPFWGLRVSKSQVLRLRGTRRSQEVR